MGQSSVFPKPIQYNIWYVFVEPSPGRVLNKGLMCFQELLIRVQTFGAKIPKKKQDGNKDRYNIVETKTRINTQH